MRLRRPSATNVDEENPYWMSFSDIMSALLVIFILASVILILQIMEKEQKFDQEIFLLERAEEVRRTILEEAAEELKKRGIRVEISENNTVLRIPNELLGFDTAAFDVQPRYQSTAREIGQVLNSVLSKDDRVEYLDTVFVEGHTDSRAFRGFMGKGNWGLSTFRAISLWQFWDDSLPPNNQLSRFTNKDGDPLFSVSGYADTRPVSEVQTTESDYQRNRRIDIRFTIRRPTSEDYEEVRSLLRSTL